MRVRLALGPPPPLTDSGGVGGKGVPRALLPPHSLCEKSFSLWAQSFAALLGHVPSAASLGDAVVSIAGGRDAPFPGGS